MNELLQTERVYVSDLKCVMEVGRRIQALLLVGSSCFVVWSTCHVVSAQQVVSGHTRAQSLRIRECCLWCWEFYSLKEVITLTTRRRAVRSLHYVQPYILIYMKGARIRESIAEQ